MKNNKKSAFTLVELIIVIAIIAILAVTAFLVLTKWLAKSRDSRRLSDLSTIDTALQVYLTENSTVPKPDSAITINASGTAIGYQGILSSNITKSLGNLTSTPVDPSDNTNYIYYTDAAAKNYQLLGFTENAIAYNPSSVNAVDYSTRYIQTRGSKLGILLDTSNNPVNLVSGLTGLDVQNTTTTYNAYFDNSNKLSGTGLTLQWLWSIANNGGNGFDAPSSCPTGFIPVPGNKDFNQPGFCVAKYEMKQINGTAGNLWLSGSVWQRNASSTELCGSGSACANGVNGVLTLDGKIVSKPDGMPIVNLNQATAIEACKTMGSGYHLITNKEYMIIARNIEVQGKNRNSGIVGSGGIYRGKDVWGITVRTGNKDPLDLSCGSGETYAGADDYKSLVQDANNTSCSLGSRNKRELYLSNNQTIWDLSANVWEHVNKADTIDGTGFNSNNFLGSNSCGGSNWYSFYGNDGISACSWSNNYSYSLIGPQTQNLNANNGIGRIYSYSTVPNNVFIRGGSGGYGARAGIYSIYLSRDGSLTSLDAGFRCAR